MWSLWRDGVEHRLDAVPLADVIALEDAVGDRLEGFNPRTNAAHAKALALLLVGDTNVRLADFRLSEPDRPAMWSDGVPKGGKFLDAAIAKYCRPPYSFTPHQVRTEFTIRDLQLIGDAGG